MDVKDVGNVASFSVDKMKKINLFQTGHLLCDVYCLEPGQSQKIHTHDESDKVYMVLNGKASVRVGEDEQTLSQNQIVIAPAGHEHGVSNPGSDRLSLLVFMAPVRLHKH